MKDYPAEFDELHAVELAVPNTPDWVHSFWHDEEGNITAQLSKTDTQRTIGNAEEEADAIALCVAWLERYNALAERVGKAQDAVENKPIPAGWWADIWKDIADIFGDEPKGDDGMFTNDSEAGDTYCHWNDDDGTYEPRAYSFDFGKDEDGCFIKVGTWDGEDWSYECFYEVDALWAFRMMDIDIYFADWAEYYLYQFRTGLDPLDVWYKVPTDEDILKSVEDNLRLLQL